MFLVEQHVNQAVVVRPTIEMQQIWHQRYGTNSSGDQQQQEPGALGIKDRLEDASKRLHNKTTEINRLITRSMLHPNSAESAEQKLQELEQIIRQVNAFATDIKPILTLPQNSNFQRQRDN